MESLGLITRSYGIIASTSLNVGGSEVRTSTTNPKVRPPASKRSASLLSWSWSNFSFNSRFRYLWPRIEHRCSSVSIDEGIIVQKSDLGFGEDGGGKSEEKGDESENWILKILNTNSLRLIEKENDEEIGTKKELGIAVNAVNDLKEKREECTDVDEICDTCNVDDADKEIENEDEIKFDRDSFSSLLKKVSMADAKLYAKLSYLGSLTYSIPKIQPENLLKCYKLQFVTSSLDKKTQSNNAEKDKSAKEVHDGKMKESAEDNQKNSRHQINASTAYQIAASAASHFRSSKNKVLNSDMSIMADSMTAVVGAKEDLKQAVADDLNSLYSSPCEWYICDDAQSLTRFFVIQGSESMASWQANLLFEPVQFEGLDVLVHRGIYEAARGIYEQMLPEIRDHMKSNGDVAKLRFTGHSLGGSLALLLNLMLLIRNEVPKFLLLPVIAFGAPYVMCGGDALLRKLGLPKNHLQAIAIHRDIVPRAFSVLLSNHLVELLKAVNGKFRTYPCLNNQKFLFAPMGDLLVLQPDSKFSPHHHLLPPGNGLYHLISPTSNSPNAEKLLKTATKAFLNSPHPLEILSDRAAYGSEGTIIRDHDMSSYLNSIRGVIKHDLNRARRKRRAHRRKNLWHVLVSRHGSNSGIVLGCSNVPISNVGQRRFDFSGVFRTGRNTITRFSRLVASQHMQLFFVLLFPARMLIFEKINLLG